MILVPIAPRSWCATGSNDLGYIYGKDFFLTKKKLVGARHAVPGHAAAHRFLQNLLF